MVEAGYDYKMNTERGFEKDPDATVYILNYDKPVNEQWVFVRETGNDSTIFEIKSNRKRYSDKKNHTLVKKD
jgi:copper homeostasis protein (lipoprotein)